MKTKVFISKVSCSKGGNTYLDGEAEVTSDDFDLSVQTRGTDRATMILLLDDVTPEAQLEKVEKSLQQTPDLPRLVVQLGSTGQQSSRMLQELQLRSTRPRLDNLGRH